MRRGHLTLTTLATASAMLAAGCSSPSVFDLAVGDCFDAEPGDAEVRDVPVVDCSEPHDNEVFHIFEVADGDYPGTEDLVERAREECVPAFTSYVGTDLDSSRLGAFPITPTEGSWENGDRTIVCALYDADGDKLAGAMQDADR